MLMTINQLFITKPSDEIISKFIGIFGYNDILNIDKDKIFTKNDLLNDKVVEKFIEISDALKIHYLPCKQKVYFNNINLKKILTILRQILKLYDYKLVSNDKYISGTKIIMYNIVLIKEKKTSVNCVVTFD